MSKLKLFRVRHVDVYEEYFLAMSREEAKEKMDNYKTEEDGLISSSSTTAKPLRPATLEEVAEYLGDTVED